MDSLRQEPARLVQARRRLRAQNPARHQQASRYAGGAGEEVRSRGQPENRQGARPRADADVHRPRRRGDRMKRRAFITLLTSAAAAWPLAARAQQPKVPTIGALVIGNISPEEFWREFRQGLRDLGYIEGQNIRFRFRSAEGKINRLPELAAELVRLKVDAMVTWFTPTAVAAKQATREIPIVMAETGDPIGTGLVMSLPRP